MTGTASMTSIRTLTIPCALLTSLIVSSGAVAQTKAPVTGKATNITQTTAQLSGTFSGGMFASMGWGPKPKQGMANCGPLPPMGPQSCTATPLTCGTTYYFAATDGQQTGKWLPFMTKRCGK